MGTAAKRIEPENHILSILSPEDRLDAAFRIAGEAFKKRKLTVSDIEKAVKSFRRKTYAAKNKLVREPIEFGNRQSSKPTHARGVGTWD